jgi:hypothetical protein
MGPRFEPEKVYEGAVLLPHLEAGHGGPDGDETPVADLNVNRSFIQ